jgi:glycosyltransferase involved in cell wall biosynthesis/SAM-dependent methyltransferase
MGWFPDQENGLNRYFRSLSEALGSPPAVVVGPAADAPPNVCVVEDQDGPALRRVLAVTRAALARAPQADVVDTHFPMYAFLPVLLGLRGKPLVVHFQGPWGNETDGAVLAARVRWAIERVVHRRARGLIVLSHAFGEMLVARSGVRPELVHVVRPGVDLERFSPGDRAAARRQLGLPEDRLVVLTARRLVPRMGIDVLLDAVARLGEHDVLLLVVGDGEQRPALEEQARRLGIEQRVRFLGKVSDDELVAAYRAADVAATPSLAFEGFGLVVLEALACGTPVVGSAVEGLKEALEGFDPSLLVAPGDADALAERLRGQLPGPERCREYAEGFSWQRTAEAVLEVYRAAASAERADRLPAAMAEPIPRRAARALLPDTTRRRVRRAVDSARWQWLKRVPADSLRERDRESWRAQSPDNELTWGVDLKGDAFVAKAVEYGVGGGTILEVGPGYGRLPAAALEKGVAFERWIGLDISPQNVEHLEQRFDDSRFEWRLTDAETVELPETVDAIMSSLTLKHVFPTFEKLLANLTRALGPGGVVVVDFMEGDHLRHFEGHRGNFLRSYTRDEIAEIFGRCGLSVEAFDYVDHSPDPEHRRLLAVGRSR